MAENKSAVADTQFRSKEESQCGSSFFCGSRKWESRRSADGQPTVKAKGRVRVIYREWPGDEPEEKIRTILLLKNKKAGKIAG